MKAEGPAGWPTSVCSDLIGIDNLVRQREPPRDCRRHRHPSRAMGGREGGRLRALLVLIMSVHPPDVRQKHDNEP